MLLSQARHKAGFTMIEILVVLGLIAILTAITIPVLSSGGGIFGRDELKRTAQIVHSKIQAAQIYANTYRVNTAVVYALDNWVDPIPSDFPPPPIPPALPTPPYNPPIAPPFAPLMDSLTGTMTRAIIAAAVMYELPLEAGASVQGMYVPIPTEEGSFEIFPGDSVITLVHPDPTDISIRSMISAADLAAFDDPATNGFLYLDSGSRYEPNLPPLAYPNLLYTLGMSEIPVITGDISTLGALLDNQSNSPVDATALSDYVNVNNWQMPAHKFNRVGKMELPSRLSGAAKERFIIYAAPSPLDDLQTRFVEAEAANPFAAEAITIPIEIFRSTGRVRIGG